MLLLFWVASICSVLFIILICYYYRKYNWKIKILAFRLNKMIRNSQRDKKVAQRLLKDIYVLLNKSIANNDVVTAYQAIDLLKLAFGYGIFRQDESVRLMAISVAALNKKKPDMVSFILDAFRPLIRQLLPECIPSAAEQLTLIGVIALKQRQNFLVAKVTECIFLIMDRTDATGDKSIISAAIKAFKVMGVLGLRRRDVALFREMSVRLSGWFTMNRVTIDIAEELVGMLTAWLHRIVGINNITLFEMIEEFADLLITSKVLESKLELLCEEWGNLAASACLNPNNVLAGKILSFLFRLASSQKDHRKWARVVAIAGRVTKLAVSRHGIVGAFMVFHPMLEVGRNLLWSELRFVQCIDEYKQKMLFTVVRESLIIISFAAKQDLVGSSGQTIVDVFKCWVEHPDMAGNHKKSIKKYCQMLLLFWLKDKRQVKKNLPYTNDLTEPILFTDSERERFKI